MDNQDKTATITMLIVHEFMNAEDMANSPVGENLAKFLATAVLTGCQIMWY
ncbi:MULTISPECIES: hypothetical protein [Lactobacillaceae]|uniref:Uncharacterized protein n=5 Tax=Lacticaseibacillus paracasei TaxID=1597 RepID=A0AAN2B892_LACPA|nr:hypothetical protein [Lacticaseibacillus paracasei]EKP98430.1 hypothetical protein LCA12A_2100 [Lacticaseibacillus casei 12A]EKQ02362.1 hypothetical protein LCA211_2880 [Lacticaseibacillus casei 21/1]EPC28157.1 hypothetical protein Lpp46_0595 [Lacticaseibacillus paracasei subsp. paracasei Lpp46]EPC38482.1 hypothetical protein Lpp225_0838 [Lacticaseibacillus paracasei subsp. paracasei Lpp225]EPC56435.1 hypothetical protein Lpp77_02332 [Lacticaseibacillus paracasei subsp. paracasei CNCM I-427